MSTSKRKAVAAGLAVLAVGFAGGQGCKVDLAPNEITCPPLEDFKNVSPLLEKRCGTLDCHGNTSRPMRIYGQYGLRYGEDEDLYSGNLAAPTTQDELERNYYAVCGLEPEKMTFVQRGEEDPETLTLVRKPRLTEKHKGGRIWNQGKVEDRCFVGWIESDYEPGEMDATDCKDAVD